MNDAECAKTLSFNKPECQTGVQRPNPRLEDGAEKYLILHNS
jgi:hypothetical protein